MTLIQTCIQEKYDILKNSEEHSQGNECAKTCPPKDTMHGTQESGDIGSGTRV